MAEWIGAWSTLLAALAAISASVIAWWQLSNLNSTLRMNALTVVLQLESEMNARKQRVDEWAAKTRIEIEVNDGNTNEKLVEILSDEMNGYLENWLNSADRLAFCINRGYLVERDWKSEYRDYFATIVRTHEALFGPSTIYTNIIDLHNKWQRQ